MNKKDYMYKGIEPAAAAYFLSLSQTSLEMSKRTFTEEIHFNKVHHPITDCSSR